MLSQFASYTLAAVGALLLSTLTVAAAVGPAHSPDTPASFALASSKVFANG